MSYSFQESVRQDMRSMLGAQLPWTKLRGRTVLISGAAGFFPSYLVDCLLTLSLEWDLQIRVICLVRDVARGKRRFDFHQNSDQLTFYDSSKNWNFDIEGKIDIIIHAASPASPKIYLEHPFRTVDANCIGTLELLNLARSKNCSCFLYFSSAEVYGTYADNIPLAESYLGQMNHLSPRAAYSQSKKMGETLCFLANSTWGVPTKIIRPFHVFGPGMRLDDGRVFADFTKDILNGEAINIHGSGSDVRAFCYLSDAITAIFHVIFSGDSLPYNIGNPVNTISIEELAKLLVKEFGEKHMTIKKTSTDSRKPTYFVPDVTRLKSLGWTPQVNLVDGFRRTVASYDKNTSN